MFAPIGAVWIYVRALLPGPRGSDRLRRGLIGCALGLVLASHATFLVASWTESPALLSESREMEATIRAYRSDQLSEVPRSVAGGHFPEPFSSSLALLERHQLNLFSEPRVIQNLRKGVSMKISPIGEDTLQIELQLKLTS